MGIFDLSNRNIEKMLKMKQRELSILHELDKLKESASDTKLFLEGILRHFMKVLRNELGVVLLHDSVTKSLEIGTAIDKGIFNADNYDLIKDIARDTITNGRILVINNTKKHQKMVNFNIKNMLSSPIRYRSKVIGVIQLFNSKRIGGFKSDSLHLFSLMLSHIDSTIEYSKLYRQIEEKDRELSVLYSIDKLRDTIKDFDTLMKAILSEMTKILEAEVGFIALYDKEGNLVDVKVPSNIRSSSFLTSNVDTIDALCRAVFKHGDLMRGDYLNAEISSFIAIPASLEGSIAVFGVLNSRKDDGFSPEDEKLLKAIASQADSAIFEDQDKQQIKSLFKRYVSPEVMESMLNDEETDYLQTKKQDVTVLFADIRGFTAMSERLPPEEVVEMLNEFFSVMTETIMKMRGTLDKFMGDGIMAVFGAPIYYEGHALRAIRTAYEMQKAFKELQNKWISEGRPLVELGIGINSGVAIVGNIGCSQRLDYTVIGDVANTASRLCSVATGGQIILSNASRAEANGTIEARSLGFINVKGKKDKLEIHQVVNV